MNDVRQFSGVSYTWDNGKGKIKPGRYSFPFVLVQVEQKEVTLKKKWTKISKRPLPHFEVADDGTNLVLRNMSHAFVYLKLNLHLGDLNWSDALFRYMAEIWPFYCEMHCHFLVVVVAFGYDRATIPVINQFGLRH